MVPALEYCDPCALAGALPHINNTARRRHAAHLSNEEVVYAVREVMCFGGWVAGLACHRTERLLAGCVQWTKE